MLWGRAMEMAMREERRRQYESDPFGWEKCIATIWLLVVAACLIGSIHNRFGKSTINAASPGKATVTETIGSAADQGR